MVIGANSARVVTRRGFLGAGAAILLSGAGADSAAAQVPAPGEYKPLDPAKRIKVGIVGGNFGASFHWHLHPNCTVHAVSDLIPERRRNLQTVYRCELAYESLELLIRDPQIDAVAVFTGAPDHVRHCTAAMNAGKHVMCAVPACMSLEEANRLRETKERTGRRYMMAETSFYRPEAIAARDLYRDGAFGELFYSETEYDHPVQHELAMYWYDSQGKPTWRNGYPPMLYPIHATGFLVGTSKERIVDVSCIGLCAPLIDRVPPGNNGYGVGRNQYDNPYNAMVTLGRTNRGHIARFQVILTGANFGERAQLHGTNLILFSPNDVSGQPLQMTGKGAAKPTVLPDYLQRLPPSIRVPSGHGDSHTHLVHEFIAALVEDREPAIDVYEALAMTVPGIVAMRSARREGERLKVPNFDRKTS